ncbi:MAG: hypothetical protein WCE93_01340, partial [Nitrososphaeraceae archaeon]
VINQSTFVRQMMYVLLLLSSDDKTIKIASNLIWPRIFCSFQYLIGETKPSEFHGCIMITSSG